MPVSAPVMVFPVMVWPDGLQILIPMLATLEIWFPSVTKLPLQFSPINMPSRLVPVIVLVLIWLPVEPIATVPPTFTALSITIASS